MQTLGAALGSIEPGVVEIEMPFRADFTQQHGFVHGGIITTILDSACGYAAFSLSSADTTVLTVEYKVNFLAPARGERFLARGEVVRPRGHRDHLQGRRISLRRRRRKAGGHHAHDHDDHAQPAKLDRLNHPLPTRSTTPPSCAELVTTNSPHIWRSWLGNVHTNW